MKSLYGSPIPEGAVTAVVRPVFGRGNTQALFKGAIEVNGVTLDECAVSKSVAENAGFWSYIEAQKRAARDIGTEDKGIFSWKLSIQYLDQSGAPALVDGKTSVVTAEAYEFYRNGGEPARAETTSALDRLCMTLDNMQRALADNAKEIAVASMQPLLTMAQHIVQMSKDETGRADEMTKVAFKGIREAQPQPDVFDGLAKVIPAGAMALKALKDLKN